MKCFVCGKELESGKYILNTYLCRNFCSHECEQKYMEKRIGKAEPTTAEKLLWLAENVFQINIINNGCSIEIRPNNSCEEARYFIGIDAAYDWSKEQE